MEGEKVFYKKINDDEFFMIGDNRDNFSDLRFWGSVVYKNIVGLLWFVYFSLSLKNSLEMDVENNFKKCYLVCWECMFKSVGGLEKIIKKENVMY